jgi:hypothetical protein
MLRISLIVAILAGIGALVVSQLQVATKITQLTDNLNTAEGERDRVTRELQSANSQLSSARSEALRANQELETTKADLEAVTLRASEQEKRANDAEQRLYVVTDQRNKAQTELRQWQAFEKTPDQIRLMIADNKRLAEENNIFREENRSFSRQLTLLQNRLLIYEEPGYKVPLPEDLRGTVLAVDPRYEFIVLDIGSDDGALEQGEMLVSRAGKLVAKVRILSVQSDRSVANILPEWKQAEIMEGDVALVGL